MGKEDLNIGREYMVKEKLRGKRVVEPTVSPLSNAIPL